MTDLIKHATTLGAVAALALVLAANDLRAQEEAPAAEESCMAWLTPATVTAGESPVAVEVRLAQEIGTIIGLEAGESGLALAEPDPEAEQAMAAERAEGAEPMVRSENTQVVRLDATDARPGDYSITLVGEAGECTGDISVVGSEAEPALEEGDREDESKYGQ